MKTLLRAFTFVLLSATSAVYADVVVITSPTHEQTFAFGSERHQAWEARGTDHHLALSAEFTNDPYVSRVEIRQYDDFVFDFPDVRLGADGRTFYYHPPKGRALSVAQRSRGFLGIDQIKLVDNAELLIRRPHGYLSVSLIIHDRPVSWVPR